MEGDGRWAEKLSLLCAPRKFFSKDSAEGRWRSRRRRRRSRRRRGCSV
jgi:hypothetical protein